MYNVRLTDRISSKLSVYEAYMYYCLALCTDFNTMESHARQIAIAKLYYDIPIDKDNISNSYTDNVRKYLQTLESCEFITISKDKIKGQFGTFEKCKYKLSSKHFFMVSNKLYDEPIKKELKGFLILLKSLALNGTNLISYTLNELADKLIYSRRQISTYIKELKELGYLKKDKKGYSITRNDLFIILTRKYWQNIVKELTSHEIGNMTKSLYQYIKASRNDFKYIKNMEAFCFYALSGVPYKSKKKKEEDYEIIMP